MRYLLSALAALYFGCGQTDRVTDWDPERYTAAVDAAVAPTVQPSQPLYHPGDPLYVEFDNLPTSPVVYISVSRRGGVTNWLQETQGRASGELLITGEIPPAHGEFIARAFTMDVMLAESSVFVICDVY